MMFSDFNTSMLDYDYNTAYAFLSAATKLDCLDKQGTTPTNYVKFQVYAQTFPVTPRDKYTGFEIVPDLDKIARDRIAKLKLNIESRDGQSNLNRLIEQSQSDNKDVYINLKKFDRVHGITSLEDATAVYRNYLIQNASKYQGQPNVLYYSGGADSEMVLWSFMKAGVDFVPVTFVYTDNQGNILNAHDTAWADEFCEQHDLPQVKRVLNIEEFWQSPDLLDYAQKSQTQSPQIAAYFKMVDMVHHEIEQHGFDNFAGRKYHQFGKLCIPSFPDLNATDFYELAQDIWCVKLFSDSQCDAIINVIENQEFATQDGDHIPMQELILEEFDPVFYNALVRYLSRYVEDFYYDQYHNAYFDVLSAWFNRMGPGIKIQNSEKNNMQLHHDMSRISMSLVLNKNFTGGNLCFPRQNFTDVEVPRGTLLMWPGQITHPYSVSPVILGIRYSLVIFTKLESFSTRQQQLLT